ncbi:MaoC family dehydratase N-terminal domain-containing protein [Qipengyuania sp. G39]|uniref:MaoC family dehydratase N-terminal domain-containing protein n=1 Tax=Qipengyuania profundimaris TaxID=3067652 RepID=A0ABT9HLD0_9SPHN|nr:MaoC family dehydratase N-terminal domain-containing protein [Qipengyuania sp. G39]MDP4573956.1 MaoC family dehydratase N-terminal domain-containing protein [Qipengyuania sp. G39]
MGDAATHDWSGWLGREQVSHDLLDPALAARWAGTFDLAAPDAGAMPQGIHLCLCTPDAPSAALGEDGHPERNDRADSFFPPVPLPRRMWAASKMQFHAPLVIGAQIERVSRIASIEEKSGRSGTLVFVDVDHRTSADGALAVTERQTLVYREAAASDAPLSPPPATVDQFDPADWDTHHTLVPDPRLLFRYSALTFNTHRIHYDAPYARDVERYRGLVVHGPLMASLLLQLAAREFGDNRLASFGFRAISPAIADEPLHLALRQGEAGIELAAIAADGRECLKARASLT